MQMQVLRRSLLCFFLFFWISDVLIRLTSVRSCEQAIVILNMFKRFLLWHTDSKLERSLFTACFRGHLSLILFSRCGSFISRDYTFT